MVGGAVAQHGPEDIEPASGQGQDGLFVVFAFGAFALVVGAALGAVPGCGLCCQVEGIEESAVVALGSVVVAAEASGVTGDWRQTGYAGQSSCAFVCGDVAASGGEEFGRKKGAEAGHAEQDLGALVFAKTGLDLLVDLVDFVVQVQHCMGESGGYLSADFLSINGGALRVSCRDSFGGNCFGVVAALVAQPGSDAGFACAADAGRGCVFVRSTTAALTMA